MLYFGMLGAMFCCHVEDNHMYSTSYLHRGAPKLWYGIPPADADRFDEVAVKEAFPFHVQNDTHMLLRKSLMVPPTMLLERGVRVSRLVQQPGEFVVTLPRGYHCGFSLGFNAAEAVNFCYSDWVPLALQANDWYRAINYVPVVDLEHMFVSASLDGYSAEVAEACEALVRLELELRAALGWAV